MLIYINSLYWQLVALQFEYVQNLQQNELEANKPNKNTNTLNGTALL